MKSLLVNTIILALVGIISTGLGGVISALFKIKNKNTLARVYEITAGLMTGIVCFSMLKESYELSGVFVSVVGVLIGVFIVFILDSIIESTKVVSEENVMPISVVLVMALHNIVEGLAIGTSFFISQNVGISMLVAIAIHNIPEGMVVGILNRKNSIRPILFSSLVGAFLGLGGLIGSILGSISNFTISICLSIASGAMLYIVACDLIPQSKVIIINKKNSIMYILGIILGLILSV